MRLISQVDRPFTFIKYLRFDDFNPQSHFTTLTRTIFFFAFAPDNMLPDCNISLHMYNFQINPLTRNDPYSGRTAPLNSTRCILYIYSANIGTEYFKRGIYSPFFS